jgi:calcineurin-like phosphoesterase family protein
MTLKIVDVCPMCGSSSFNKNEKCYSCGHVPEHLAPKVFYTSDTHFWHKNILKYCPRPWSTIEEMNEGMIERWNRAVRPQDIVYHIGDVGFGSTEKLKAIVQRLNGQKIVIKGNHDDRSNKSMIEMGFQAAVPKMERDDGGRRWLLIHNPADAAGEGAENVLCGHVHQHWARQTNYMKMGIDVINVGVDVRDFTPRTMAELLAAPITPDLIDAIPDRHKGREGE